MNQLNEFIQQVRSLVAGMTPQSKLMAVLLTLGIGISSVFLIQSAATGNGAMVYLLDGKTLSEDELDNIEFALGNSGLRGFERVGNRMRVPRASSDVYYKAISEGKAVPERMGNSIETALNSNTFLESTKTTEQKLLNGKQKSLSNAIKRMDPIIQDAFITYDEKRAGFSGDRKQTASVAIQTKGSKELAADQRRAIISFVEKSFAGLKQSDIAVYCNGQTTIASDDPTSVQQSKYYQLKRQQEEEYRLRAERLLTDYGNVRLDVNVELDPTAGETTESLSFNEKPTVIQSASSKKDAKSQRSSTGGRPGTEPNALANKSASLNTSPDQNTESKEQTENEKSVTGNTLKRTETVGHKTTRVSVSVSIPFSYYRKVAIYKWRELNPSKPASEFPEMTASDITTLQVETERSIQKKINAILPVVAAGEDKFPRIAVEYYQDMPVPEPPAVSFTVTALEWLSQSWQTLALMGLVGAALVSLRSFAKTVPASNDRDFERGFDLPLDDATDIDLSSLTDDENEAFVNQPKGEISPPRLRTTGGDIKSDLTALVRENPDAAATMLRNWITEST